MIVNEYTWLEAKYYDTCLMSMTLRKSLNLAYLSLREAYQYDTEGWENNIQPIFDGSVEKDERGVDVIDYSLVANSKLTID